MKKIFFLLLILLVAGTIHAQFNKRIFRWDGHPRQVDGAAELGDWNGDGFGEFMIYDCSAHQYYIYYGGNPIDSIPRFIINLESVSHKTFDTNGDGYKDIVVASGNEYDTVDVVIYVYFGGPAFDTIPDQVFAHPPGASLQNFAFTLCVLPNFDGSGRPVLMVADVEFSSIQREHFYMYRTSPSGIDTVPYKKLIADTTLLLTNYHRFYLELTTAGDINGDGLTDILVTGRRKESEWKSEYFLRFYLGNTEFNLVPAVTYYQNQHRFDCRAWKIVEDMNGDHRDDILIPNYGGFYPNSYQGMILGGKFPIDTIPIAGLNTYGLFPYFFYPVSSPGDVNGDGYNDLVFGANSNARSALLYLGGRPIKSTVRQVYSGDDHCDSRLMARIGDVNGDGLNDICVGEGCDFQCDGGYVEIYAGDTLYRDPTNVRESGMQSREAFSVREPSPNPFNSSTTIKYSVTERCTVSGTLYDMLGRQVKSLLNRDTYPGEYDIEIKGDDIPGGVYFIVFRAGANDGNTIISTKKIINLK